MSLRLHLLFLVSWTQQKKLIDKLQVTQNKLTGFVLNLHYRAYIDPKQFKLLNRDPVEKMVQQIFLCHVFKIKHGFGTKLSEWKLFPTRYCSFICSDGSFSIPKVTPAGSKSFVHNGCTLWNKLPSAIKNVNGLDQFKLSRKIYKVTECNLWCPGCTCFLML